MSEQPENVRKAVKKILAALDRRGFSKKSIYNITGRNLFNDKYFVYNSGDIYDAIIDVFEYADEGGIDLFNLKKKGITRADARTSWLFNKYGIPGLRFLDQFSREDSTGQNKTHNYVIWNMDRVTMTDISDDSDELARKTFYNGGKQQLNLPFGNNERDNSPETYNQFISVKATERLAEAGLIAHSFGNSQTLETAKALDSKYMPASFIWRITGWVKGKDGEWRTEIPDGEVRDNFMRNSKQRTVNLHDVYDNDVLYAAYPFLKDMPLHVKKLKDGVGGFYDPNNREITLNQDTIKDHDYEVTRSALIHEIQHAIQDYY